MLYRRIVGGGGVMEIAERRHAARQHIHTCVYYRPGMGLVRTRSQTLDLSPQGMRLRVPRPVEVGALLQLEIEVVRPRRVQFSFNGDALMIDGPPVVDEYRIQGRVQRCTEENGSWHVGITFTDVPEEHQSALTHFLSFIAQDEHLF